MMKITVLMSLLYLSQVQGQQNDEILLVVGGWANGMTDRVEVRNLTGNTGSESIPECLQDPAPYPILAMQAASGWVNGRPLVCGGYFDEGITDPGPEPRAKNTRAFPHSDCYSYDIGNNKWDFTGPMEHPRHGTGYDSHPDWGLVMSGGMDGPTTYSAVVDYTFDGVTFNRLPDLPETLAGHCLVILDQERLFVAGGEWSTNFYLFSRVGWFLVEGTGLLVERTSHPACGAVINPRTQEQEVIIAAGDFDFEPEGPVEIYNVATGQRRLADNTFITLSSPVSARFGDTFVVMGGFSYASSPAGAYMPEVYQYVPEEERFVELVDAKMSTGIGSPAPIVLPSTVCA